MIVDDPLKISLKAAQISCKEAIMPQNPQYWQHDAPEDSADLRPNRCVQVTDIRVFPYRKVVHVG